MYAICEAVSSLPAQNRNSSPQRVSEFAPVRICTSVETGWMDPCRLPNLSVYLEGRFRLARSAVKREQIITQMS